MGLTVLSFGFRLYCLGCRLVGLGFGITDLGILGLRFEV